MWKIKGKYADSPYWEEIDSFDTEKEAREMLGEYSIAFGSDWLFKVVKGR